MLKRVLIIGGVVVAVVLVGLAVWQLWPSEAPNRSGLRESQVVSTETFVFEDDDGVYLCPPDDLYTPSRIDPEAGSPRCDAPRDEVIPLEGFELELPEPNEEDIRVAYATLTLDVSSDGNSAEVVLAAFAPDRQP